MQPAFEKARVADVKNGPRLFETSLTLPLYDGLTEEKQGFVVESLASLA